MLTGTSKPSTSNAFLAIAWAEQKLSHDQAWQIELSRRSYLKVGLPPPKTGELAEELAVLLHADVDSILSRQSEVRREGKTFPDPLARPSHAARAPKPGLGVRGAAGAAVLLLLVITWFLGKGDWARVAIAAGIASAVWLGIENIWPIGINRHLAWHRAVNAIPASMVPVLAAYGAYVGIRMSQLVRWGPFDVVQFQHLWNRLAAACALLTVLTFAFLMNGRWRHREIWLLAFRIDLMRSLVSQTFTSILTLKSASTNAQEFERKTVEELLHGAARVLSLNPWARTLARLAALLGKSAGGAVLWYLEPEGNAFRVRAHVAPAAPPEVAILLQQIADKHMPVALNEERYQKAKKRCTRTDGTFDRAAFLAIPDRSDYMSLVGYVFARRQGLGNGDTSQCLVFDKSYLEKIDMDQLPSQAKAWLDFASAAAYPVFSGDVDRKQPAGVLLAFKSVKNGITAEDKSVLVMVSKLIGMVLAESRRREAISSSK